METLTGQFYKGIDGIIFVYDITDRLSFWPCDKWIQGWQRHIENLSTMPVLFVGNKSDNARPPKHFDLDQPLASALAQEDIDVRVIDEEGKNEFVEQSAVKAVTKQHGFLSPLECSAKTGHNVDKVFETIGYKLAMISRPSPWKCLCL